MQRLAPPLIATAMVNQTTDTNATIEAATHHPSTSIHVPVGKDGDGAYSASTKGCMDVIQFATPLILQQVSTQVIHPGRPFHVADYGTADAGTSLGLLSRVVEAVREREAAGHKAIVLHYEDQRGNEWKSVFNHVLGINKVTDAYGHPMETPYALGNVFVECCGVSFHTQCYPSNSIDLGFSFTAMHWLSTSPDSLKGAPYMHAARCPTHPPEAEKRQAEKDWDSILEARANELVPGGRFMCANFCKTQEGHFLGQTDVGASMWDSFQAAWDSLAKQGLIDEEERLGVSFPNYYRTKQEFIAGIEKRSDLRLISIQEKVIRCPYREQYVAGNTGMTPQAYAKHFVPTTRSWSQSTFKAGLHPSRPDDEKASILAQFWANYEALVASCPEKHGMDYVHAYLVVEKI